MGGYLVVSLTSNSVRRSTNGLLFELTLHQSLCRLWNMDTHELNVWNKLFSSALDIAGASPGTTHDTLNVLLSKISDVLQ